MEGGKEDGMGSGGKVRVGCKPAAVLENRTVDGAANTTMQGGAQTRGDQSVMHARQAGPSGAPKRCILAKKTVGKKNSVEVKNRPLPVQVGEKVGEMRMKVLLALSTNKVLEKVLE